jgi:hypothetical protein
MSKISNSVVAFEIGDKVMLATEPKTEGVIVHRHGVVKDGREWSVHWHKRSPDRGIYNSTEIIKHKDTDASTKAKI